MNEIMKMLAVLSILFVCSFALAEEEGSYQVPASYQVPVYDVGEEYYRVEVEEVKIEREERGVHELKWKLTYEDEFVVLVPAHWVSGVGYGRSLAEGFRRPVVSTVVRVAPDKLVVILRGMVNGEGTEIVYLAQASENGEWSTQRLRKEYPIFNPTTPENTPPQGLRKP